MAVILQVGRFDATRKAVPSVQEEDFHSHSYETGVFSSVECNFNGSFCRMNAAVRYALSLTYLIVIGSPQNASVDTKFRFMTSRA